MIFELIDGELIPRRPWDSTGYVREADGTKFLSIEQAAASVKRDGRFWNLARFWMDAWQDRLSREERRMIIDALPEQHRIGIDEVAMHPGEYECHVIAKDGKSASGSPVSLYHKFGSIQDAAQEAAIDICGGDGECEFEMRDHAAHAERFKMAVRLTMTATPIETVLPEPGPSAAIAADVDAADLSFLPPDAREPFRLLCKFRAFCREIELLAESTTNERVKDDLKSAWDHIAQGDGACDLSNAFSTAIDAWGAASKPAEEKVQDAA
jgi:hypothetical protein